VTAPLARAVFGRVVRPPYVWVRHSLTTALFDRRLGVDTEGVIHPEELGFSDDRYTRYVPTALGSLRRILPPREVDQDDVLLDLGSGKGRVVLQAALNYPFRRVYGVELSEQLHAVAERNLEAGRDRLRCQDVRLVNANALDFEIPDDVTVVWLYNPFVGEVFEAVVAKLLASVDRAPRRVRVVYGNPIEEAALLRTGRFHQVRTVGGWRPGAEWARSNSYRMYEVS
jgi:hypothetical protein